MNVRIAEDFCKYKSISTTLDQKSWAGLFEARKIGSHVRIFILCYKIYSSGLDLTRRVPGVKIERGKDLFKNRGRAKFAWYIYIYLNTEFFCRYKLKRSMRFF